MRTFDVARLEGFYSGVLGLTPTRRDAARGSVWLEMSGGVLMLERAEPGEAGVAPGTMDLVAFAIDDKDAWRGRLERAGVSIEAETEHTLYFRDPDGRRIGVSAFRLSG